MLFEGGLHVTMLDIDTSNAETQWSFIRTGRGIIHYKLFLFQKDTDNHSLYRLPLLPYIPSSSKFVHPPASPALRPISTMQDTLSKAMEERQMVAWELWLWLMFFSTGNFTAMDSFLSLR